MREWVEQYMRAIAAHPDQVSVSQTEGVKTVILSMTLADEDKALFDGRSSRLRRALNATACLAGAKSRTRYVVTIAD